MIIGHQVQWKFLKKIAKQQRIPQALLFIGPEQIGKKRVALEFVKFLNCQNFKKNKDPCQNCSTCLEIEKRIYPDFYLIEPENKEIKIGTIRELLKNLIFQPFKGNFKIAILDNAHALNLEAQNCLLKTLEEPKGKTILILVSSQPEILKETLRSRTQILKFYPLRFSEIKKYFQEKIPPSFREQLIVFSEGKVGKVIELLKDHQKLKLELEYLKFWEKILSSSLEERLNFVRQLFEQKNIENQFDFLLEILLKYLRKQMLEKLGVKEFCFNKNIFQLEVLKEYSFQRLKKNIEMVQDLRKLISFTNINPRLALENLLIKL